MTRVFGSFDVTRFWDDGAWAKEQYQGGPVTDEDVAAVETELGYRLPRSYVELMKVRNGGAPKNTCHRTKEATSWAEDHVAINGIFGLDRSKDSSLCGSVGSAFWVEEWGYPPIGIYFGDCPSAGHDMFCLDYRGCGPEGEPKVVHVDQEFDYAITDVAPSFESFIRGLEAQEAFDED